MNAVPGGAGAEVAPPRGPAGKLAARFMESPLTPLLLVATVLLGIAAVKMLPREEEPQIHVPMIDVHLALPGAGPEEVEARLSRPVEQAMLGLEGVEHVYTTSASDGGLVTVRFEVGTRLEPALVRVSRRVEELAGALPSGAAPLRVVPHVIDDLPVLGVTLHGGGLDAYALGEVARAVADDLSNEVEVAVTRTIGAVPRAIRVEVDPARAAARGVDPTVVASVISTAAGRPMGAAAPSTGSSIRVETGAGLTSVEEILDLVVTSGPSGDVRVRDVATVRDGSDRPTEALVFLPGGPGPAEPAVTLAVAKRPGANATALVDRLLRRLERLDGTVIPEGVSWTTTRDYGHTAAEKSDELLLHMGIAVFGVALLILFFLGRKASLVVLLAIPSTLALTLLVFLLMGYTLNRITLFALIFSIGILVDDAIVVVENIVRHARPGAGKAEALARALRAVDEVGNPTILATWAVIAAILPMAFVGGLMGPYMRPIPVGATAAMLFSLVVAFTITPWAAVRLVGRGGDAAHGAEVDHDSVPDDRMTRLYRRVMDALLHRPVARWSFLGGITALLLGAMALVPLGAVRVKMLPFDNKSEFQVILEMPEGTPLEDTLRAAREVAESVRGDPAVKDIQVHAGTAAPVTFNGLVRHYFARTRPHQADIQVNLVRRDERDAQSHDIAKRLRPLIQEVAGRVGAVAQVVEVPPGPPVLQTLVAEIHGPDEQARRGLAVAVADVMRATEGIVDVDTSVKELGPRARFVLDRAAAARHGLGDAQVGQLLGLATSGVEAGVLVSGPERGDVPVRVEVAESARPSPAAVLDLEVLAPDGQLVPLREIVDLVEDRAEPERHRKDGRPITLVTGDVAGGRESPVYAILGLGSKVAELDAADHGGAKGPVPVRHASPPDDPRAPTVVWDGEWQITLEVFRDLGLAFAAVLLLIYALMAGWFGGYVTPFTVMAAIPFSLVGILPAHAAMGAYFTATSMIGFMAGAGIVVRNAIILVDFIEQKRAEGVPLDRAVIDAGAVRFRPMLLTALAVVVGAAVILADPIFQGLAVSLIFGEIASLLISRMAVPVLHFMAESRRLAR